jgi:hypothetical protein
VPKTWPLSERVGEAGERAPSVCVEWCGRRVQLGLANSGGPHVSMLMHRWADAAS